VLWRLAAAVRAATFAAAARLTQRRHRIPSWHFPGSEFMSALHRKIHIRSLVPQPRPAAQDNARRPGKLAACIVMRWLLLACESSSWLIAL
jgi:hypothetical protein